MFLISWIDKKVKEIENDIMFKKYFEGAEIEEIEGSCYLDNLQSGIDIVLTDVLVVRSIHIYAFIKEDKGYSGEMPFNLEFSMSRYVIREIFGEPNKFGGGYTDILGPAPIWDKYYLNGFSLHFQYPKDGNKIDMITIASLTLEAYFNIGLQ